MNILEKLINKSKKEIPSEEIEEKVGIDRFLDKYKDNFNIEEERRMRRFMEKMVTIYEIIYPDESLAGEEFINDSFVNQVMFKNTDIDLDWSKFLSIKSMIKLLSEDEKNFLRKPKYKTEINLTSNNIWNPWDSLTLTKNGVIKKVRLNKERSALKGIELVGKRAVNVIGELEDKGISEKAYIELKEEVARVDRLKVQRREMLDCIMECIMQNGNDYIGARRALLFAHDFNLDLDKALKYELCVTTDEVDIATYLKQYNDFGGNMEYAKNLLFSEESLYAGCYNNEQELNVALRSEEEKEKAKELMGRLVSTLYGSIDQEELEKEKVKKLRLERKLNKNVRK